MHAFLKSKSSRKTRIPTLISEEMLVVSLLSEKERKDQACLRVFLSFLGGEKGYYKLSKF